MEKLKLSGIEDDKPIKVTIELPAAIHRDLVAYGEILGSDMGQPAIHAAKLIAPMLARFIATDRVFKNRKANTKQGKINSHQQNRLISNDFPIKS